MDVKAKLVHRWLNYELFKSGDKFELFDTRTGERRRLTKDEAHAWVKDRNYRTSTGSIEIIQTKQEDTNVR